FYFLEMNTRLQVEHPVTELTTGLDLVALQLSIAEGQALAEAPPASHGHAIEARLYAEDPANDWQPQSGPLHTFAVRTPALGGDGRTPNPRERARVRVDSGVESGSVVTVHYDPMLAKVICWAPDRATAARRLAATLAEARIHGVRTNRDLLVRVLRHPAFLAGRTDTAFFDRHGLDELARPLADGNAERLSALAAALVRTAADRRDAEALNRLPIGWRNVVSAPQRAAFTGTHGMHEIEYRLTRDGLVADGNVMLVELAPGYAVLEADGVRRRFEVASYDGLVCVDSALGPVSLTPVERFADPSAQVPAGSLLAPMPGTVTRVAVGEGDRVAEGQPLLWMEAMKMEHT
ncbi:MAG: biotin/lipoyl-containing protein, partial [Micromonosporaceae bacterium]